MPRYLIQSSHEPTPNACLRVMNAFNDHGSHYLTKADFGCDDDEHVAWVIVEADDKPEALRMVPPSIRAASTITMLRKYTPEDIRELSEHIKQGTAKPEEL